MRSLRFAGRKEGDHSKRPETAVDAIKRGTDELKDRVRQGGLFAVLFILKYGFSLIMTVYASVKNGVSFFLPALLELLLIFCFSNRLLRMKKVWIGTIVNAVLMFLYNAQIAVLIFGHTYVTLVMLTNVDSIEDLSGQALLYIASALLVVLLSVIPVHAVSFPNMRVASCALALELVFTMINGSGFSPLFDYYEVSAAGKETKEQKARLASKNVNPDEFYHAHVSNYYSKGDQSGKNVILIFTEGLSQEIVDDSRNILPNVASYEKKGLFVKPHTFENACFHTLIPKVWTY